MGHILKEKDPFIKSRCDLCGKAKGEDSDYFVYYFEDLLDESQDAREAYDWFSERKVDLPPSDLSYGDEDMSREEKAHFFVLEDLVERILSRSPICGSCLEKKKSEKKMM